MREMMKFAASSPALLLVLLFSSISFADIAAPMKPLVQLNITNNGQPYLGEVNVTYLCLETQNESAGRIALLCQNGSCNNGISYSYADWFGPGSSCFYSKGRFIVEAEGTTTTTDEVSLEQEGDYYFEFDVGTGRLTASEKNPKPPEPNPCCPSAALAGLVLACAFAGGIRS